jgi:hypothetical protein
MENISESTDIHKTTGQGSDGIAGLSHDISITGAGAFPADGDGVENNELAWAQRQTKEPVTVERKTELAGWGVRRRKKTTRPSAEERVNPVTIDLPAEEPENHGDVIFLLYDRMDRLIARQDRKIERLSRRVSGLEERGRFR